MRSDDKTLEAGLNLVGATRFQPNLHFLFNKRYSRDNSVILYFIQAYDLDVELGLLFLSFKPSVSVRRP